MSKTDSTTPASQDAIQQFRQSVANVWADWAMSGTLGSSGLRDGLAYVGVDYYTAAKTDASAVITVTVPATDPKELIPSGDPSDYTPDALARFASEHLAKLRRITHRRIKDRCQSGYINSDQALAALKTLGYSDAAMPAVKSTAEAVINDEFGNSFTIRFTQDGSLSAEEVTEALEAQFGSHPVATGVLAAFPNATGTRLPKLISCVSVDSSLTWPSSDSVE